LTNLALLCTTHHRLMHEGGWDATGDPEPGPDGRSTLKFLRPDGSLFVPHPMVAAVASEVPGDGAPPEVGHPGSEPPAPEGGHRGENPTPEGGHPPGPPPQERLL
ncbi:MAG: hypothetical protein ACRDJU_12790, partial [Actinomycetota bacterium]